MFLFQTNTGKTGKDSNRDIKIIFNRWKTCLMRAGERK